VEFLAAANGEVEIADGDIDQPDSRQATFWPRAWQMPATG
jgi:hypothetical protein